MPLELVHTYLVHPNRDGVIAQPGGARVALEGKLHRMLNEVYVNSIDECKIDISFNPADDGAQTNPCRDLVVAHVKDRSLVSGRALAERLAAVTTNRSGMGLMFLLLGTENGINRIVLSRFPAHSAISAEENQAELNVEFLERVFMRSAYSYKAAVYEHASLATGFWSGRVVDKQFESREIATAGYWVKDFLASDFRTTDAMGTRRLAKALKDAVRNSPDLETKQAIAAAVTLANAADGEVTTVRGFLDRFGLPAVAKEAVEREISDQVAGQVFRFNSAEFATQLPYRSMELNTGVILTAPADEFNEVFETEVLNREQGRIRISTEGRIVTERVEKR